MTTQPSGEEPIVRLVDRGWAAELDDGLSRDATRLRVICPFIKVRVLSGLLERHDPDELLMITRFNLADFATGVSDIASLRLAVDHGGRVKGLSGLHSKLFLFGETRAAVTSANLTERGLGSNHEFGCVSEHPQFVASCGAYFERLWQAGGEDVTLAQLDDWATELEQFLDAGGRPAARALLADYGVVRPALDKSPPGFRSAPAGWPAESGQAFVKFFGEGSNRVDWSFEVLEEVGRSGCHWACTYPASKRPRAVRDGDTIFVGRLVKEPNDTLIFGRAIGREHRPGHDEASPGEIEARWWKAQWPNYVRVHHAEFVAGAMRNGVSLAELMDALGSDSFTSTQHNARTRNGRNTNPRKAFMQQPAVRLSDDAAGWLTNRLELAFDLHGRIPDDDLNVLDWPMPPQDAVT